MRVLFLPLYPRIAPSPRYRIYQMLPYLESVGIQCDAVPLLNEQQYLRSRKPGQTAWKSRIMAWGLLRRLALARKMRDYDLVYILKGAYPFGPPICERRYRKTGVPLVFDFDDAIHIHKSSLNHRLADLLRSQSRVPEIIGLVDRIIVPNSYLADYSRNYNANVSIVPEAEDTERLVPRGPHKATDRLVIGWVGSPSTAKYMELVEPALREISRRYPHVVVRVIGGNFEAEGIRTEQVAWSLEREVEQFHGLDIGIMPLPNEEWSRGKSACKLRQYMSTGVPGVATAIGYNCELVQHGETGLLATTQEEWIAALSRLIESPEERNRIAQNARAHVVENFAIPVIGRQLARELREVAGRPEERAAKRSPLQPARTAQ